MIVFIHLLNDSSGSPRVLSATISALHLTHQNNILYVGRSGKGVLDHCSIEKRYYKYRRGSSKIETLGRYLWSQIDLYRRLSSDTEIQPDALIYVNTLLPFGGMLWGKLNHHRVVVHAHEVSITPKALKWFLTKCARLCADRIIYVSQDHRARLKIREARSVVLYNPLAQLFSSARADIKNVTKREKFVVLMLASPRKFKGIEEFFALASLMQPATRFLFKLVINGTPLEVEKIKRSANQLSNVVVFPATNDPRIHYLNANFVVNLSRVDLWIETFGMTIIEAMSFGLPVIAPPVGGPIEIITHGVDGFLIDSRDTEKVRDVIYSIADNARYARTIGKMAKRRALDFSFERYSTDLRTILGSI